MRCIRHAMALAMTAFLAAGSLGAQGGGTLAVAAAADLQTALPEIAAGFERATGIKVTISFGSSGTFFAQIQNGAPYDVFFSADADYPHRLAAGGQMDRGSVYEYATGRLVVWTRRDNGLDPAKGLDLLRDARVRRIAIANPAFAPYGRAAVAALTAAGLSAAVKEKLVFAENVAQAAQLAESGNADVAVIGHALALGPALREAGRFVEVPARLHPPIIQAAGIVAASKQQANARALLDYLKGDAARQTLQSFGFGVPTRTR